MYDNLKKSDYTLQNDTLLQISFLCRLINESSFSSKFSLFSSFAQYSEFACMPFYVYITCMMIVGRIVTICSRELYYTCYFTLLLLLQLPSFVFVSRQRIVLKLSHFILILMCCYAVANWHNFIKKFDNSLLSYFYFTLIILVSL